MSKSVEEIAYQQSARAMDAQISTLDELRSRTAIVLAASGLTASFLGNSALEDGVGPAAVLATLVFAVGAFCCIVVLFPKFQGWLEPVSAKQLLADLDDPEVDLETPNELHRHLAVFLEEAYESNAEKMEALFRWLWVACIALGVQIGLWLLELGVD
jgi:hypothetical protein